MHTNANKQTSKCCWNRRSDKWVILLLQKSNLNSLSGKVAVTTSNAFNRKSVQTIAKSRTMMWADTQVKCGKRTRMLWFVLDWNSERKNRAVEFWEIFKAFSQNQTAGWNWGNFCICSMPGPLDKVGTGVEVQRVQKLWAQARLESFKLRPDELELFEFVPGWA